MARRLPKGAVAVVFLALLPGAGAAPPGVLVQYSFEEETPATGPDTFAVWQGAKGGVRLSSDLRVSGYRSVQVRDVQGDGDFPELQGFFPVRRHGQLYFHFALLTTSAQEPLNVGLAGPRYFQMGRDGIAFWLSTRDGMFVHVSDSIRKKLVPVEPFVWYAVDVAYDVARGRYDLHIRREGAEAPVVDLKDQANASSAPASAVDRFSFVGAPYGDRSNVTYYLDDVVVGTDQPFADLPLVAPGRRKLFVDAFVEHQRLLQEKARCLPAADLLDLGLGPGVVAGLEAEGLMGALEQVLNESPDGMAPLGGGRFTTELRTLGHWRRACARLEGGELEAALAGFEEAERGLPEGRLYALARAATLAALGRHREAEATLALRSSDWGDDPRYGVTAAYVGLRRGDLDRAEEFLRDPASQVLDRRAGGDDTLLAEQYYYVQLWRGRHAEARDYALALAARGDPAPSASGASWTERAADAAFHARDLLEARQLYERARGTAGGRAWIDLKLADVAFLEGDLEVERALRERHYGRLAED